MPSTAVHHMSSAAIITKRRRERKEARGRDEESRGREEAYAGTRGQKEKATEEGEGFRKLVASSSLRAAEPSSLLFRSSPSKCERHMPKFSRSSRRGSQTLLLRAPSDGHDGAAAAQKPAEKQAPLFSLGLISADALSHVEPETRRVWQSSSDHGRSAAAVSSSAIYSRTRSDSSSSKEVALRSFFAVTMPAPQQGEPRGSEAQPPQQAGDPTVEESCPSPRPRGGGRRKNKQLLEQQQQHHGKWESPQHNQEQEEHQEGEALCSTRTTGERICQDQRLLPASAEDDGIISSSLSSHLHRLRSTALKKNIPAAKEPGTLPVSAATGDASAEAAHLSAFTMHPSREKRSPRAAHTSPAAVAASAADDAVAADAAAANDAAVVDAAGAVSAGGTAASTTRREEEHSGARTTRRMLEAEEGRRCHRARSLMFRKEDETGAGGPRRGDGESRGLVRGRSRARGVAEGKGDLVEKRRRVFSLRRRRSRGLHQAKVEEEEAYAAARRAEREARSDTLSRVWGGRRTEGGTEEEGGGRRAVVAVGSSTAVVGTASRSAAEAGSVTTFEASSNAISSATDAMREEAGGGNLPGEAASVRGIAGAAAAEAHAKEGTKAEGGEEEARKGRYLSVGMVQSGGGGGRGRDTPAGDFQLVRSPRSLFVAAERSPREKPPSPPMHRSKNYGSSYQEDKAKASSTSISSNACATSSEQHVEEEVDPDGGAENPSVLPGIKEDSASDLPSLCDGGAAVNGASTGETATDAGAIAAGVHRRGTLMQEQMVRFVSMKEAAELEQKFAVRAAKERRRRRAARRRRRAAERTGDEPARHTGRKKVATAAAARVDEARKEEKGEVDDSKTAAGEEAGESFAGESAATGEGRQSRGTRLFSPSERSGSCGVRESGSDSSEGEEEEESEREEARPMKRSVLFEEVLRQIECKASAAAAAYARGEMRSRSADDRAATKRRPLLRGSSLSENEEDVFAAAAADSDGTAGPGEMADVAAWPGAADGGLSAKEEPRNPQYVASRTTAAALYSRRSTAQRLRQGLLPRSARVYEEAWRTEGPAAARGHFLQKLETTGWMRRLTERDADEGAAERGRPLTRSRSVWALTGSAHKAQFQVKHGTRIKGKPKTRDWHQLCQPQKQQQHQQQQEQQQQEQQQGQQQEQQHEKEQPRQEQPRQEQPQQEQPQQEQPQQEQLQQVQELVVGRIPVVSESLQTPVPQHLQSEADTNAAAVEGGAAAENVEEEGQQRSEDEEEAAFSEDADSLFLEAIVRAQQELERQRQAKKYLTEKKGRSLARAAPPRSPKKERATPVAAVPRRKKKEQRGHQIYPSAPRKTFSKYFTDFSANTKSPSRFLHARRGRGDGKEEQQLSPEDLWESSTPDETSAEELENFFASAGEVGATAATQGRTAGVRGEGSADPAAAAGQQRSRKTAVERVLSLRPYRVFSAFFDTRSKRSSEEATELPSDLREEEQPIEKKQHGGEEQPGDKAQLQQTCPKRDEKEVTGPAEEEEVKESNRANDLTSVCVTAASGSLVEVAAAKEEEEEGTAKGETPVSVVGSSGDDVSVNQQKGPAASASRRTLFVDAAPAAEGSQPGAAEEGEGVGVRATERNKMSSPSGLALWPKKSSLSSQKMSFLLGKSRLSSSPVLSGGIGRQGDRLEVPGAVSVSACQPGVTMTRTTTTAFSNATGTTACTTSSPWKLWRVSSKSSRDIHQQQQKMHHQGGGKHPRRPTGFGRCVPDVPASCPVARALLDNLLLAQRNLVIAQSQATQLTHAKVKRLLACQRLLQRQRAAAPGGISVTRWIEMREKDERRDIAEEDFDAPLSSSARQQLLLHGFLQLVCMQMRLAEDRRDADPATETEEVVDAAFSGDNLIALVQAWVNEEYKERLRRREQQAKLKQAGTGPSLRSGLSYRSSSSVIASSGREAATQNAMAQLDADAAAADVMQKSATAAAGRGEHSADTADATAEGEGGFDADGRPETAGRRSRSVSPVAVAVHRAAKSAEVTSAAANAGKHGRPETREGEEEGSMAGAAEAEGKKQWHVVNSSDQHVMMIPETLPNGEGITAAHIDEERNRSADSREGGRRGNTLLREQLRAHRNLLRDVRQMFSTFFLFRSRDKGEAGGGGGDEAATRETKKKKKGEEQLRQRMLRRRRGFFSGKSTQRETISFNTTCASEALPEDDGEAEAQMLLQQQQRKQQRREEKLMRREFRRLIKMGVNVCDWPVSEEQEIAVAAEAAHADAAAHAGATQGETAAALDGAAAAGATGGGTAAKPAQHQDGKKEEREENWHEGLPSSKRVQRKEEEAAVARDTARRSADDSIMEEENAPAIEAVDFLTRSVVPTGATAEELQQMGRRTTSSRTWDEMRSQLLDVMQQHEEKGAASATAAGDDAPERRNSEEEEEGHVEAVRATDEEAVKGAKVELARLLLQQRILLRKQAREVNQRQQQEQKPQQQQQQQQEKEEQRHLEPESISGSSEEGITPTSEHQGETRHDSEEKLTVANDIFFGNALGHLILVSSEAVKATTSAVASATEDVALEALHDQSTAAAVPAESSAAAAPAGAPSSAAAADAGASAAAAAAAFRSVVAAPASAAALGADAGAPPAAGVRAAAAVSADASAPSASSAAPCAADAGPSPAADTSSAAALGVDAAAVLEAGVEEYLAETQRDIQAQVSKQESPASVKSWKETWTEMTRRGYAVLMRRPARVEEAAAEDRVEDSLFGSRWVYPPASEEQPLVMLQDCNFRFLLRRLEEQGKLQENREGFFSLLKKTLTLSSKARRRRKEEFYKNSTFLCSPYPKPIDLPPRFFFVGRPAAEVIFVTSTLGVRKHTFFRCMRLSNFLACRAIVYYQIDANIDSSSTAAGGAADERLLRRWKRQKILRNAPHTHHRGVLVPQLLVDGQSVGSYEEVMKLEDDGLFDALVSRGRCPTCLQPRHVGFVKCTACGSSFRELISLRKQHEGQVIEMYRGRPTRSAPVFNSRVDENTSWELYSRHCGACGSRREVGDPFCPRCHLAIRDIAIAKVLGLGICRSAICTQCGKAAGGVQECLEPIPEEANPFGGKPLGSSFVTSRASPLCSACGCLLTYLHPVNQSLFRGSFREIVGFDSVAGKGGEERSSAASRSRRGSNSSCSKPLVGDYDLSEQRRNQMMETMWQQRQVVVLPRRVDEAEEAAEDSQSAGGVEETAKENSDITGTGSRREWNGRIEVKEQVSDDEQQTSTKEPEKEEEQLREHPLDRNITGLAETQHEEPTTKETKRGDDEQQKQKGGQDTVEA